MHGLFTDSPPLVRPDSLHQLLLAAYGAPAPVVDFVALTRAVYAASMTVMEQGTSPRQWWNFFTQLASALSSCAPRHPRRTSPYCLRTTSASGGAHPTTSSCLRSVSISGPCWRRSTSCVCRALSCRGVHLMSIVSRSTRHLLSWCTLRQLPTVSYDALGQGEECLWPALVLYSALLPLFQARQFRGESSMCNIIYGDGCSGFQCSYHSAHCVLRTRSVSSGRHIGHFDDVIVMADRDL